MRKVIWYFGTPATFDLTALIAWLVILGAVAAIFWLAGSVNAINPAGLVAAALLTTFFWGYWHHVVGYNNLALGTSILLVGSFVLAREPGSVGESALTVTLTGLLLVGSNVFGMTLAKLERLIVSWGLKRLLVSILLIALAWWLWPLLTGLAAGLVLLIGEGSLGGRITLLVVSGALTLAILLVGSKLDEGLTLPLRPPQYQRYLTGLRVFGASFAPGQAFFVSALLRQLRDGRLHLFLATSFVGLLALNQFLPLLSQAVLTLGILLLLGQQLSFSAGDHLRRRLFRPLPVSAAAEFWGTFWASGLVLILVSYAVLWSTLPPLGLDSPATVLYLLGAMLMAHYATFNLAWRNPESAEANRLTSALLGFLLLGVALILSFEPSSTLPPLITAVAIIVLVVTAKFTERRQWQKSSSG